MRLHSVVQKPAAWSYCPSAFRAASFEGFTTEGLHMVDAIQADAAEGQTVQLAVSNAMVRLYKEHFGRGPTKARTHFAGHDALVCTLENSFTPTERKLVLMGENQRLRDM